MVSTASNGDIVRGAYEAFARGDVPAVLAMLDADIDWYSPDELPGGGAFRGREGVGRFFAGLPEHYQELAVRPQRYIADGENVVVIGVDSGRIGDATFELGFAHVWQLRDGKATSFREYSDTGRVVRLLPTAGSTAGAASTG